MYLHLLEFKFRYIMLHTVEYQVYIILQFPGHSIGLYNRMSFAYMVNFEPLDSSNVDTKFIYIRNSNGPSSYRTLWHARFDRSFFRACTIHNYKLVPVPQETCNPLKNVIKPIDCLISLTISFLSFREVVDNKTKSIRDE